MNKRIVLWIVALTVFYALAGLMFPIMLHLEFGCFPFASAPANGHAGIADYAILYPHMVLYPVFWFPFSLVCLVITLDALWRKGKISNKKSFTRPILMIVLSVFAVFSAIIAVFDSQGQAMMLFEIGATAQETVVDEDLLSRHSVDEPLTVAESVFVTLKESPQASEDADGGTPAQNLKSIRLELFDWDHWKNRKDELSTSRLGYIITMAAIVWTMLASVFCASMIVMRNDGFTLKRRAIFAVFGAIFGLALWFPHRLYYNLETKSQLFDISKTDSPFHFPIPRNIREIGFSETEAIPLFLLLVFMMVMGFLVLSEKQLKKLKEAGAFLMMCGLTAGTLVAALKPDIFGELIGLNLSDPDWMRFTVSTMVLFVVFAVYFVVTYREDERSL